MRRGAGVASAVVMMALACGQASSQANPSAYNDDSDDNPRGNVHLGTPIVIPLNPTARAVHLGFGFNVGGGYNFTRKHGLVGEFMYNNLLPTNEALAKIRTALGDRSIDMGVSLTSLTANYRYEWRGKNLGTYFLGGSGLYYRHTHLSKEVTTGQSIECTPTWVWWGFSCTGGVVTESQTVGSWSATAPGYNGGIGFTVRVGEPPYRIYAESRYHYAPNSRINTQLIDISFGIRY
jgi:opacity protein-like surface antigen